MRYVAFACHAPMPDFCAFVLRPSSFVVRPALHARLAAASAAVAATFFWGHMAARYEIGSFGRMTQGFGRSGT